MAEQTPAQGATSTNSAAYGTRQAIQTVLATSELHTWAQQCLTFELSESVGALGAGANRAIRISSKGTAINAAQYRGDGMALANDPLSRGVTGHLAWLLDKGAKNSAPYTNFVLEDFYLALEVVSPGNQGSSECPGEEWYLSDISPTTKINDVAVSTSTSSGFNIGMMGDVPSAGYDESSSNGRDWTLPDYALLAIAGHNATGAPHGAWHIKRSDPSMDPQIANAALTPDLELVFTTRPDAPARRFTSIAASMTVSFQDTPPKSKGDKKIEELLKKYSIFQPQMSSLINIISGNNGDKENTVIRDTKVYSFIINYIIDWHTGEIFTKIANNASGSPIHASELIVVSDATTQRKVLEEYADDRKRLSRGFEDASITAAAAKEHLAQPIAAQNALDLPMIFNPGSALGVASSLVGGGGAHIDLLFPAYFSENTASAFRIYSGFFDQKEIDASGSSWLPFKNAIRIKAPPEPTPQLLWCAPAGRTSGRVVGLSIGHGGKGVSECRAESPMAALGSSHVPDGLYATGDRNIVLWLDHIYDYVNRRDGSAPIEIWPSPTGVLEKVAFTNNLSVGISNGKPVFSTDFFKSIEDKSTFENVEFISDDKNKRTCNIYEEVSNAISSSFRFSIFSIEEIIVMIFDSNFIFMNTRINGQISIMKAKMKGADRFGDESVKNMSANPDRAVPSDFLWHIQQLAIRFSKGSDITGVVLRAAGSIEYDGNYELVITER